MKHKKIFIFGIIGLILMIGIISVSIVVSNAEIRNKVFSQMGESSEYKAEEGVETQADTKNYLKSTANETTSTSTFLGIEGIARRDIENVTFIDSNSSVSGATTGPYDVSEKGDNSIQAWYMATPSGSSQSYTIYIASDEEIYANPDSSYLFAYIGYGSLCQATQVITNIDLLNTSDVTNMSHMFDNFGYYSMTSLNLRNNFDTSNVTDMSYMFSDCGYREMTELDLGEKFDTRNVTDMSYMFSRCGHEKMTSLNLGDKFNTSNVLNMSQMFWQCGYDLLTSLDLGNKFDTSKVTDVRFMFQGCGYNSMTSLNLGPAFINIPEDNESFVTNCGKSGAVIYVPAAIYYDNNHLKLNGNETEGRVVYNRGTIELIDAIENDDFGGTTQKNIMIYADNTAAKDILGDVNGDGFITTYDANMVLAYEVTRRRRTNSNRFCNV